jgi:hypothetical protein
VPCSSSERAARALAIPRAFWCRERASKRLDILVAEEITTWAAVTGPPLDCGHARLKRGSAKSTGVVAVRAQLEPRGAWLGEMMRQEVAASARHRNGHRVPTNKTARTARTAADCTGGLRRIDAVTDRQQSRLHTKTGDSLSKFAGTA